jgi:hypothetical protein
VAGGAGAGADRAVQVLALLREILVAIEALGAQIVLAEQLLVA